MQLKFFHDVTCIIFIIEVLLLSPFINNFFGIILTYSTNHDILYHKSHWTCRLITNLLQKWLVITVRPTTSVKEKSTKEATAPQHTRFILPSVSPDKILRLYCVGGIFLYGKRTLKISWADRTWYRLSVNAAAQTGAGTAFGVNGDPHTWAAQSLLIFAS